jgi:glyoxylate reductase
MKDVDGLLPLLTERIDGELMDAGERLKVVSNYAVGFNNIDTEAATERGIYVTNTPGILTDTTADAAFSLLMAIARRIPEADRHIRAKGWIHAWGPRMYIGSDIHGKTLGILGMGRIGSAITKRAKGFDMNVVYHDVYRREDLEEEMGITYMSKDEVIRSADFLSLHVPLTPETHHMISVEELVSMKNTAFLINTSRGPVVDEKALADALKDGVIAGAGLDVFETEPVSHDSPLLELDNIVLTPHLASGSIETRTKMATTAATNLVSVLQGRVPPNLVNLEVKDIRPLQE